MDKTKYRSYLDFDSSSRPANRYPPVGCNRGCVDVCTCRLFFVRFHKYVYLSLGDIVSHLARNKIRLMKLTLLMSTLINLLFHQYIDSKSQEISNCLKLGQGHHPGFLYEILTTSFCLSVLLLHFNATRRSRLWPYCSHCSCDLRRAGMALACRG